jgi:hypothetical protein
METLVVKQKVNARHQVVIDLPQYPEGEEVEIMLLVTSLALHEPTGQRVFDLAQWADQWETDLGAQIQSTDVASFTGRSF